MATSPDTTLITEATDQVTHHTNTTDYLGHTFHSVVGSVELWLGAQAVLFNLLVIIYYRGLFTRVIPMMYLMIAVCDMITGVAAFLTGILILSVRNHLQLALHLSYIAYPVYSVAIPTSIFLNVNLAVIRTITLQNPLYRVVKELVVGVVGLCAVGWAALTAWHLNRWEKTKTLLGGYIYAPGQFQAVYHQKTTSMMECTNVVLFVVVPYLLPSAVVLGCVAVQVHLITRWRGGDMDQSKDGGDRWRQQKHITLTIISLSLLFFVCNTVFVYLPIAHCQALREMNWFDKEEMRRRGMLGHITGLVFPFVNAAFSPVILVVRGKVISRMFGGDQTKVPGKGQDTVFSNVNTVDKVKSTEC